MKEFKLSPIPHKFETSIRSKISKKNGGYGGGNWIFSFKNLINNPHTMKMNPLTPYFTPLLHLQWEIKPSYLFLHCFEESSIVYDNPSLVLWQAMIKIQFYFLNFLKYLNFNENLGFIHDRVILPLYIPHG